MNYEGKLAKGQGWMVFQSSIGRYDDFFLFGSIFEATMIDKKLSEKPISFELSIGKLRPKMTNQVMTSSNFLIEQETLATRWMARTNQLREKTNPTKTRHKTQTVMTSRARKVPPGSARHLLRSRRRSTVSTTSCLTTRRSRACGWRGGSRITANDSSTPTSSTELSRNWSV